MIGLERRQNLLFLPDERWRPAPLLAGAGSLRRLLDLQAASIWRDLRELFLTLKRHRPSADVLDVGCGAQPYRKLVPAGYRYRAIDHRRYSREFGHGESKVDYFEGDRWPVEDESQDVVLCTEVAEHVYDCARLFAESRRCLRKNGRLLLTVPFAARWHFIPHDYWRFTPSSLDRLLEEAGFRHLRIYARGNALTVACYKLLSLTVPPLFHSGPAAAMALWITLGITLLPFTLAAAAVGQLSLLAQGGNDCLGYTVVAERAG